MQWLKGHVSPIWFEQTVLQLSYARVFVLMVVYQGIVPKGLRPNIAWPLQDICVGWHVVHTVARVSLGGPIDGDRDTRTVMPAKTEQRKYPCCA